MSKTLALFPPSTDLAGQTGLPPLLQRPVAADPIARLTLTHTDESPDGSGGARWLLKGAPAVIMMGERLFSGARSSKRHESLSWPCVEAIGQAAAEEHKAAVLRMLRGAQP